MNNRIRVLRAERRWSQAELAERVGVSRNSINSVENGKFDPSLPLAFRIADALGLTVEAVFSARRQGHPRVDGMTRSAAERARELRRRNLAATARVLATPQRSEIVAARGLPPPLVTVRAPWSQAEKPAQRYRVGRAPS